MAPGTGCQLNETVLVVTEATVTIGVCSGASICTCLMADVVQPLLIDAELHAGAFGDGIERLDDLAGAVGHIQAAAGVFLRRLRAA